VSGELGRAAERYANTIFSMIPELVATTMAERRRMACWHVLKCRYRLGTCRPSMRPWWRWRRNVHDARCAANRLCGQIDAACLAFHAVVREFA